MLPRQITLALLGSTDLSTSPPLSIQPPASPRIPPPSPDPPRPKRGRGRNIEAELVALYGTPEALIAAQKLMPVEHFPYLSPSERRNHLSMKHIWLWYFTEALGSEEQALATLQPNAPLPERDTFVNFIHDLGCWRIDSACWSYVSTKKNADFIFDMLYHCRVEKPSAIYRDVVNFAIELWYEEALVDNTNFNDPLLDMPYTTCYFCGLYVFKDVDASTHFEECYANAVSKIFKKITSDLRERYLPQGFKTLSHTVSAGGWHETIHTFCPLCLFDVNLSWDQRMTPQPSATAMAQHIVSHAQDEGEFRMDKMLHCGFFPWEEENPHANWFSLPDMFTHLHNDHGYNLLACVNSNNTWLLDLKAGGAPSTIFYKSDILRIRELLGHDAEEFGTVCLADHCRTTEAMAQDLAAIDRMYEEQDPDREMFGNK